MLNIMTYGGADAVDRGRENVKYWGGAGDYFPYLSLDWQNTLIFACREAVQGGEACLIVYGFTNQRLLFVLS